MFKENNQFVSAVLVETKVMIFVPVVLKTIKGMELTLSVIDCGKKWHTGEILKRPRLKEFKSTRTVYSVRQDLNV
jgi:hypothetical protein